METQLGQIAGLLQNIEQVETPLQRYLKRFGKQIVIACVVVSALVFMAGWLQGLQSMRELFLTAVSLAVAAISRRLACYYDHCIGFGNIANG